MPKRDGLPESFEHTVEAWSVLAAAVFGTDFGGEVTGDAVDESLKVLDAMTEEELAAFFVLNDRVFIAAQAMRRVLKLVLAQRHGRVVMVGLEDLLEHLKGQSQ